MRKGTWAGHVGYDLPGYGDVESYQEWTKRLPIEGLQALAQAKGYGGFVICENHTVCYFKKLDHDLTIADARKC